MTKAAHFRHLCATHIGYWQQYEEGRGPGQQVPVAGQRIPFRLGLGDVVAWIIFRLARGDEKRTTEIGIKADRFIEWVSRGLFKANTDGTCNCNARHAWLNSHFPLWPIRWPWRKS